jgi:Chalcone isomerase-like
MLSHHTSIIKILVTWLLASASVDVVIVGAMTDKATGISFAPQSNNGLTLFGVGVRKKGPIKVYSVGMYGPLALKSKLHEIRSEKAAVQTLRDGAKESSASFLLEMSWKVGADTMAKAIADSVGGRCTKQQSHYVEDLKALIATSVAKNKGAAATKGTKIQFNCSPKGVEVAVDGKVQGSVGSKELAAAMCDVYLDDKCVSPALRKNILATNCM